METQYPIPNIQCSPRITFDIYLVGVGGQGVLTIGDLIGQAALEKGIPTNFYPTKGMAQRGGSVKAQLRLGRETVGPRIPERGADLVIAMELSEALKAVRFAKPGTDFVLFGSVWQPTDVMLGKAPYPALEQVREQIQSDGIKLLHLDPGKLPVYNGVVVPANIYVLGAALGHTGLGHLLDPAGVGELVRNRWRKGREGNALAYRAGLEAL